MLLWGLWEVLAVVRRKRGFKGLVDRIMKPFSFARYVSDVSPSYPPSFPFSLLSRNYCWTIVNTLEGRKSRILHLNSSTLCRGWKAHCSRYASRSENVRIETHAHHNTKQGHYCKSRCRQNQESRRLFSNLSKLKSQSYTLYFCYLTSARNFLPEVYPGTKIQTQPGFMYRGVRKWEAIHRSRSTQIEIRNPLFPQSIGEKEKKNAVSLDTAEVGSQD